MDELDRRVQEVAQETQAQQIPDLFPPQPLPMSWKFASARTAEGKGVVLLQIAHPGGLFQTLIAADDAERFFEQGLAQVRMAKTGLTIVG
jgi:hypothetical protein